MNRRRVGSGYIVGGSTVLTANHVAEGSDHTMEWDDSEGIRFRVDDRKTVLSGSNDVDIAILHIQGSPLQLERVSFAAVDRAAKTIEGCTAVGFPSWIADKDERQYVTEQVKGFINTAAQVRMGVNGGADGQLLRLTIQWRNGERVPEQPKEREQESKSPWSGMSGAAVLDPGGNVIGVVHSHNYANDPEVLTVAPLRALNRLTSPDMRRRFCAALRVTDLDSLSGLDDEPSSEPTWTAQGGPTMRPIATDPPPAFPPAICRAFESELAAVGLSAPTPWDYPAIHGMYLECERRCRERRLLGIPPEQDVALHRALETLESLQNAVQAIPVLSQVGLRSIGITKLQYLYHRHVKTPPTSDTGAAITTIEEMLIRAASIAVSESRDQPGRRQFTALARFMLGIASHWQIRQRASGVAVDLDHVKQWVVKHLEVQEDDADDFLLDEGDGQRTWMIIEFSAEESDTRQWPTEIIVRTV
ncbi:MAG: S1 family peptidase, partial [Trebonia sp.]